MRLPPLRAGIYEHYKGNLYQVLGYAHDANADDLADYSDMMERVYAHNRGEDGPTKPVPLGERMVVVYFGLQLNDAHAGPRLAVRTVDDFLAYVDPEDGSLVPQRVVEESQGSRLFIENAGYVPRFRYRSASYDPDMMVKDFA